MNPESALAAIAVIVATAYVDEPIIGAVTCGGAFYIIDERLGGFKILRQLKLRWGIKMKTSDLAFWFGVGLFVVSRVVIGKV